MNTIAHPHSSNATLRRRRGRPRQARPDIDLGTPELNLKRALYQTAESLDLLREKGLISETQHWCGLHLRWLYTLRYGLPGITAIDTTRSAHCAVRESDPHWRQTREAEYNEAITILANKNLMKPALEYCVFNAPLPIEKEIFDGLRPSWQLHPQIILPPPLEEALTLLKQCWCRKK